MTLVSALVSRSRRSIDVAFRLHPARQSLGVHSAVLRVCVRIRVGPADVEWENIGRVERKKIGTAGM
jgi:hypothetical protein